MTSTITNPKNPGSFNLYDTPPSDNNDSRWLLGQTSEGWSTSSRVEAVANAWTKLVQDRKAEAADNAPEFKIVELLWCGRTTDGEYVLVPRGSVRAVPTKVTTRSGRFKKSRSAGGALLDSLFLGHDDARDEEIWSALLAVCTQEQPTGRTLRQLNDAVAELVLIRAGIVVDDPMKLPQEHLRGRP